MFWKKMLCVESPLNYTLLIYFMFQKREYSKWKIQAKLEENYDFLVKIISKKETFILSIFG